MVRAESEHRVYADQDHLHQSARGCAGIYDLQYHPAVWDPGFQETLLSVFLASQLALTLSGRPDLAALLGQAGQILQSSEAMALMALAVEDLVIRRFARSAIQHLLATSTRDRAPLVLRWKSMAKRVTIFRPRDWPFSHGRPPA